MTPNEYQKEALRTASGMSKEYPRILNGLMGLNGEAGECIDILKKHLYQGHAFDSEHMAKELGDVAWYLAISAEAIGYDLETIFQMNIDKLRARYPDGFDAERGVSVSVFPWPDEETLRNMRAGGLISHNDYRTRLGLSPMKD